MAQLVLVLLLFFIHAIVLSYVLRNILLPMYEETK